MRITILKFSFILVLTGTLILGLSGCDDDDDETVSETVTTLKAGKICTGPTTGTYYHYAGGVIEAAKETLAFDLEKVSTVGSLENAKAIVSGECDMAIVQADLYLPSGVDYHATPESKLFSANKGSLAVLYPEMVHILVNRESGITQVADLAGKKVNIGEKDSGTYLTAHKFLNLYHQLASSPEYVYEAPSSAVAKVVAGTLDATFYVAGTPISTLANLPADANVTLIPASTPGFNLDYTVSDIPATTYPWLYRDITNNIVVSSLLTIAQSIDRTKLGHFLDTLYANKDSYAEKYHAKWALLDKADTVTTFKTKMIALDREAIYYFAEASRPVAEPQLYFCSASPTGIYTKVAKDLIPIVESTLGLSLTEKHTAGSLENMLNLYNGECAMTIVQYDVIGYFSAIDRTYPTIFSEELLINNSMNTIMPLYLEDIHLVVNTNSGIESSLDLGGKNVNMGENLSGTLSTATSILLVNNFKIEDITPFYDSNTTALGKVISGEYDAMFVTAKAPISYLVTADCPTDTNVEGCIAGDPSTLPIKMVSIQVPYFIPKTTFSANHYPWQKVDIQNSPQMISFLAVPANLSLDAKDLADFINAVYALKVGDATLSPTWDETSLEQGVALFELESIVFHWFAAKYFADQMK
jgi:TRAP transporter TAXI family solute receptor